MANSPDDLNFADTPLGRAGLLSPDADDAIKDVLLRIEKDGIETVRFLFTDQHGILRGKAIAAHAVPSVFAGGIAVPSSMVLKDTSHRTVFPVWSRDAGFGEGKLVGAGDILLVPDPKTFRRLPWSPHSAWVLCDIVNPDYSPLPFASRTLLKTALAALDARGLDMLCGFEAEFNIYRLKSSDIAHDQTGMPGAPPPTDPLCQGYQLLTDNHYAVLEDVLDEIRRMASGIGIAVRSAEVEFGPSQVEFTFDPGTPLDHADAMVMFRSVARQVCQRRGLLASFMCRPNLPNAASNGWHLHQSLIEQANGRNIFMPGDDGSPSAAAASWIAGLLDHAAESCIFSTPTVNGYKRYRPQQLAPDRIQWGHDNKGAMIRALFRPGDRASRIENRIAESAVNPHFFIASQIFAGLSGTERSLQPPPAVEEPYSSNAPKLPSSLIAAVESFEQSELFRSCLGEVTCNYLSQLKRAEWDRYLMTVSEWEHREYFSLF